MAERRTTTKVCDRCNAEQTAASGTLFPGWGRIAANINEGKHSENIGDVTAQSSAGTQPRTKDLCPDCARFLSRWFHHPKNDPYVDGVVSGFSRAAKLASEIEAPLEGPQPDFLDGTRAASVAITEACRTFLEETRNKIIEGK